MLNLRFSKLFTDNEPESKDVGLIKSAYTRIRQFSNAVNKGDLPELAELCVGRYLPGFYSYKPVDYPTHVEALLLHDNSLSQRRFLVYVIEGNLSLNEVFHRKTKCFSKSQVCVKPVRIEEVSSLVLGICLKQVITNDDLMQNSLSEG